jgi:4-aminobutyrate aminotransferase-like enzyme
VGDTLKSLLTKLKQKYAIIGDVRGNGLFLGIELVKDRNAATEADHIVNEMKGKGILLSTDGPDHNVIKIKPPMVFNRDNALSLVKNLDNILSFLRSDLE